MKRLIALLLALSALFSLAACGGTNAFALAEATYPESAPYPNEAKYSGAKYEAAYDAWSADRRARNTAASSVDGALDDYIRAALPALLSGVDGKNAVCSPVSVYMALSMLAEVTDGDTRVQILSLLGADSINTSRTRCPTSRGSRSSRRARSPYPAREKDRRRCPSKGRPSAR